MKFIIPIAVGVLCIVLGIFNMKGNISSIHSYHRHRISEQDKLPFGRLVGIGTVIMGVSIIVFSILTLVSEQLKIPMLIIVGTVILIIGLAVGLGLTVYAMIKYNKGIF